MTSLLRSDKTPCNKEFSSRFGAPRVLGILGEWLFIFRELGSTGHYFQGFGEQAHSFGDLGSPAKMLKKSHHKGKPSFCLIFKQIFGFWGEDLPTPLEKSKSFVLKCLSRLELVSDIANNFYYCGNLSLKFYVLG